MGPRIKIHEFLVHNSALLFMGDELQQSNYGNHYPVGLHLETKSGITGSVCHSSVHHIHYNVLCQERKSLVHL